MANWRQARREDKKKWINKGGGKRRGPAMWTLRLKLTPEVVRIRPIRPKAPYKTDVGAYDWLRAARHYIPGLNGGNGGFMPCSGEECLVDIYANPAAYGFEDLQPDENLAKATTSEHYVISGLVEEWFHLVKVPGKKEGTTFTDKVRCTGRHCKYCREGIDKVFGDRFYTGFSWPTWNYTIEPLNEELEKFCKCGGYIMPVAYVCDQCEEPLVHMTDQCPSCGSTDLNLEADPSEPKCHTASCNACGVEWALLEGRDAELKKLVTNQMSCPKCGNNDLPRLVLQCSEDGCEGHPHDIYDCQLEIHKKSDEKSAYTEIAGWKIQEPDPRSFDPEFQGGTDEEAIRAAKLNSEDINLAELPDYKPMTPDEQARRLNKPNPFKKVHEDQERHSNWSR